MDVDSSVLHCCEVMNWSSSIYIVDLSSPHKTQWLLQYRKNMHFQSFKWWTVLPFTVLQHHRAFWNRPSAASLLFCDMHCRYSLLISHLVIKSIPSWVSLLIRKGSATVIATVVWFPHHCRACPNYMFCSHPPHERCPTAENTFEVRCWGFLVKCDLGRVSPWDFSNFNTNWIGLCREQGLLWCLPDNASDIKYVCFFNDNNQILHFSHISWVLNNSIQF
jgi:hypothetical protein